MKKIPYPLYLALFLTALGLFAAGVLGGLNLITGPKIEENRIKELEERFSSIAISNPTEVELATLVDGVLGVYEGKTSEGEVVYVFDTQNVNSFTTVKVLVVINKVTGTIENVDVATPATTHGFDYQFAGNKFEIIGSNQGNVESNFQAVTGATTSSNSVLKCIKAAYAQYQPLPKDGTPSEPTVDQILAPVGVTNGEEVEVENLVTNVVAVYQGKLNDKECFVFETSHKNEYRTVKALIAIDKATGEILNIAITGNPTSHGLNDYFLGNDFGVIGSTSTSVDDKFENVSEATTSSNSVKTSIHSAFQQYEIVKGDA